MKESECVDHIATAKTVDEVEDVKVTAVEAQTPKFSQPVVAMKTTREDQKESNSTIM